MSSETSSTDSPDPETHDGAEPPKGFPVPEAQVPNDEEVVDPLVEARRKVKSRIKAAESVDLRDDPAADESPLTDRDVARVIGWFLREAERRSEDSMSDGLAETLDGEDVLFTWDLQLRHASESPFRMKGHTVLPDLLSEKGIKNASEVVHGFLEGTLFEAVKRKLAEWISRAAPFELLEERVQAVPSAQSAHRLETSLVNH